MKRTLAFVLILCLMMTGTTFAFAEQPQMSAVYELYSVDGYYVDELGNAGSYSFHVPQIFDDSADAEAINAEIAERFGARAEDQFESMEGGFSLWIWNIEWESYWYGTQLFLLVSSFDDGGFTDYAAYGYDFETRSRVTNEMILEQKGIGEEEYLENLREKVSLMFEDMFSRVPKDQWEAVGHDQLLEKTLGWLDLEQPMFLDRFGEIETIVKIASVAGAEWYYHLATPFAYG